MDLHYERSGDGPPLLLLHGLGGYGGLWQPVVERLREYRDLVVPDMPGFGRSPRLQAEGPATAGAIATPVIALCEELGIGRPHIGGNSLGAWVALEMAKRGKAASVTGISPAGLWRNALGPRRYDSHGLGRRLRPLVSVLMASEAGRTRVLRTTMARPEAVPAGEARTVVMNYLGAAGYREANEAMRAAPFEHDGLIDVPVTLVWGEEDRLLGRPSRTRMPPGTRFFTVPGWGHTPTWDDPDGVARLLLEGSGGE
ncbi:MAG: alpha/beta fold hydrolase [Solirubrobacterales bacterium]